MSEDSEVGGDRGEAKSIQREEGMEQNIVGEKRKSKGFRKIQ